jgi:hypothetical protein
METLTPEQAIEQAKGLTFEKVWIAITESRKEAEESRKAMEKSIAELSKNIGGLNNTIGKLTEAMFSPNLLAKFSDLGYNFTRLHKNTKYSENNQPITEVDLLLDNTTHTMAIEVKTELDTSDIDGHIVRIEKIKRFMESHSDNRILLGAVAGAIVGDSTIAYARNKGLFVLVQNGNMIEIATAQDGFTPREW